MTETRTCPFTDCEWSYEYDPDSYTSELDADFRAERHYEKAHAGRVRIQVVLEKEQLQGDREPKQIRERMIERFEEQGHDVAYVRTEVLEEPDDHSRIEKEPIDE
jgi:hypothetical protein